MKISLQTFTIRKSLNENFDESLKKVNDLGIKYLELAYVDWEYSNISKIKESLDKYDIKVGSSQIKYKIIINNFDEIIKMHKLLNCKYIAVSVLPIKYYLGRKRGFLKFADKLTELAKKLNEHDLELLYHHHNFEFAKFNGKYALDMMMKKTVGVGLVIDTYWTKKCNVNPSELIKKYKGLVKILHLRDYDMKTDAEVGNGIIDFKSVIETFIEVGGEYGAIEQATNTPYQSIGKSVNHIKEIGYEKLF